MLRHFVTYLLQDDIQLNHLIWRQKSKPHPQSTEKNTSGGDQNLKLKLSPPSPSKKHTTVSSTRVRPPRVSIMASNRPSSAITRPRNPQTPSATAVNPPAMDGSLESFSPNRLKKEAAMPGGKESKTPITATAAQANARPPQPGRRTTATRPEDGASPPRAPASTTAYHCCWCWCCYGGVQRPW